MTNKSKWNIANPHTNTMCRISVIKNEDFQQIKNRADVITMKLDNTDMKLIETSSKRTVARKLNNICTATEYKSA